jgi:LPXTG-site transpeptidase (sortase) family protein
MMAGKRSRLAIGAAALALVLAACAGAAARNQGSGSGGASTTSAASGADAARKFRSERGYTGTPAPTRVSIPSIGVDSSLVRLGKGDKGAIETPPFPVAGWYKDGPRPGDAASAVILGHVDNKTTGPAVFYRLRELKPGDQIRITRDDGSVVRFAVDRTEQFLKSNFPTDQVYYPTLTPELRLITCGGSFDYNLHHYRSNIIVFAKLLEG